MKEQIKNNGNWYIAEVVQRAEDVGKDKTNPNRRCTVWINSILIKAASPEKAYEKACNLGKENYGSLRYKAVAGNTLQWKFLGVRDIIPIYEDIEDGAEIMWEDLGEISAKRSERMIRDKCTLIRLAQRSA